MSTIVARTVTLKSDDNIVVRSAARDDAAALLDHGTIVIAEGEFVVITPEEFHLTREQEQDWIRQYGEDPGKVIIVAETSDRIIGVLSAEAGSRKRTAHRATIHITVRQEWRNRGVGSALIQSAIDWAQAHPTIEQLTLSVFATNVRAIGLYRKFGFLEEGLQPQEIKFGPGRYVDNILMYRFVKTDTVQGPDA